MLILFHTTGGDPRRDMLDRAWQGIDVSGALDMHAFTSSLYRDQDQAGLLHAHVADLAPGFVREIRMAGVKNPLMVTIDPPVAMKARIAAIYGTLMAGADDVQPAAIDEREMVARLRAIVRRGPYSDHLRVELPGGAVFDYRRADAIERADGRRVHLMPAHSKILQVLVRQPGHTISRNQLMDAIYGGLDEPQTQIIDVFMCKLRRVLMTATGGLDCIRTVWGRGFMFDPAGSSASIRDGRRRQPT